MFVYIYFKVVVFIYFWSGVTFCNKKLFFNIQNPESGGNNEIPPATGIEENKNNEISNILEENVRLTEQNDTLLQENTELTKEVTEKDTEIEDLVRELSEIKLQLDKYTSQSEEKVIELKENNNNSEELSVATQDLPNLLYYYKKLVSVRDELLYNIKKKLQTRQPVQVEVRTLFNQLINDYDENKNHGIIFSLLNVLSNSEINRISNLETLAGIIEIKESINLFKGVLLTKEIQTLNTNLDSISITETTGDISEMSSQSESESLIRALKFGASKTIDIIRTNSIMPRLRSLWSVDDTSQIEPDPVSLFEPMSNEAVVVNNDVDEIQNVD